MEGNERAKTRTLLCHVYHLALHAKYQDARDMLLMSHIAEMIHNLDISTQVSKLASEQVFKQGSE